MLALFSQSEEYEEQMSKATHLQVLGQHSKYECGTIKIRVVILRDYVQSIGKYLFLDEKLNNTLNDRISFGRRVYAI
jgi:hypothetical protein